MEKIVIHKPGDYRQLKFEDFDTLAPKENEVVISVKYIGINYADVLIRWGVYSSAKEYVGWPITPGFEVSGVVKAIGSEVDHVEVGDEVFGVTRFGGYTSEISIDKYFVFKKPNSLTLAQAAAFPSVFLTAYHALFQNVVIRPGAKILIHSCAGGVGSSLLQMCRAKGFESIGIVGSSHKVEVAKNFGADHVIDKSKVDLWTEAKRLAPEGYDIVLDANGASTLKHSYDHLAPTGKVLCYGFHSMLPKSGGRLNYFKLVKTYFQTPRFNPLDMTNLNKSLVTFNLSYLFDKKDMFKEAIEDIVKMFESGELVGPGVTEFDFKDVAGAHKALESGKTTGKLVLKV